MKVTKKVYNELWQLFNEGSDEDCYSLLQLIYTGRDITPNLFKMMSPQSNNARRHIQVKLCKCWEKVTLENFSKVFKLKKEI